MARTAGSISLVSMKKEDLFSFLGNDYSGPLVVSRKWLETLQKPCDMVIITQENLDSLNAGLGNPVLPLETEKANTAPAIKHPRMTEID